MSVNSSHRVDIYTFVWEYRLGRGYTRTAQLDDSLVVWYSCALLLRAYQASRLQLTTVEGTVIAGCPNHSSLFVIGRSIIVIRVGGQGMY
jgi:hypothetical protein